MKENINTHDYWNIRYNNPSMLPDKLLKGNHKDLYWGITDFIFQVRHNCILDLGAGVGVIPFLLKYRNFDFKNRRYVCIDHSEIGLKIAKRYTPEIEIITDTVDKFIKHDKLKQKSFDIIICSEVLEHLTDYVVALRNAFNYVKQTGVVITTIPEGRLMVKSHYHSIISTANLIKAHEAVGLYVYSVATIERWKIAKSKPINVEYFKNNLKRKINLE